MTFIWRESYYLRWLDATPPRGRGEYPRPPALDGHGYTCLGGLSYSSLGFLGLLARLRQLVERAFDAGDHAGGDARVARRRIEFVVPQQRLDDLISVSS